MAAMVGRTLRLLASVATRLVCGYASNGFSMLVAKVNPVRSYGVNTCDGDHTWGKCDRDECDFERPSVSNEECLHEFGALGAISGDWCIHCGAKLSDLKGK